MRGGSAGGSWERGIEWSVSWEDAIELQRSTGGFPGTCCLSPRTYGKNVLKGGMVYH